MGSKWMTDGDRAEVWRLHRLGLIPTEISRRVGRSFSTVASVLKKSGGVTPSTATRKARSACQLSADEREEISLGVRSGDTFTAIAGRIGRDISTVSREVARNGGRKNYRAGKADRTATDRGCRPKPHKLSESSELRAAVLAGLELKWSPQQIAASLREEHPDDPAMWISHETIYIGIYTQVGGLGAAHHRCLRTGRSRRRPHRRGVRERRGQNPNMTPITERPAEADDRRTAGHWERDLIYGRGHKRAIATLVERTSRYLVLLEFIDGFASDRVCGDLADVFARLDPALQRSLTWDQGSELASHATFTAASGVPVFFCAPRSPWQRGTNENTNGLYASTSHAASTSPD